MIDQILNELELWLSNQPEQKALYEDFLAQIEPASARPAVVTAARNRFAFSLSFENGVMNHYVAISQ